MDGSDYSVGEVLFLRSLSREEAIDCDASPPDSLARFVAGDAGAGGSSEGPALPVVARWWDVHRAAATVRRRKAGPSELELRLAGYTRAEIAEVTGESIETIRKRTHVEVDEIMAELGSIDPVRSAIDAALERAEQLEQALGDALAA